MSNAISTDSEKTFDTLAALLATADGWEQAHLAGTGAVAELEAKLEALYSMKYALCVANATLGLFAVAQALELRDAEFITTPYTYGASLSGWLHLNNRPLFADIDPMTLTLDPEAARKVLTAKTRAILAVDIYGVPCDTVALRALADEYGLWYVADGAQSFGATRDGLPASALADAVVVSFTVGKALFCGEGGAVLTNRRDLYEKLLWFTQHPQRQARELGFLLVNEFALNARIHPLAALWGNATFEESLRRLHTRQEKCFRVIDELNGIGLTEPIAFAQRNVRPSFFRLTASWREPKRPTELLRRLKETGLHLSLAPLSVDLIYHQASFQAQYRSGFRLRQPCTVAESQIRRRFCLRI